MRPVFCIVLVGGLLAGATAARAQSAQRLSVQGSGAMVFASGADPAFSNQTRLGYEGQLRYTANRLSVGAGYQRSTVYRLVSEGVEFTAALSLAFLEPRYLIAAGNRVALYGAGRIGYGTLVCSEACRRQDRYLTYGGGGGLLTRLTGNLALDLGGQYFVTNDPANSGYALARLGLSLGL